MQQRGVECAHDPCNCTVTAPVVSGEAYCSATCTAAQNGGLESDICACGHPACDEP